MSSRNLELQWENSNPQTVCLGDVENERLVIKAPSAGTNKLSLTVPI